MQVGKRDQRVELYLGCSLLEFKSLTGEHYSTKTGIGAAYLKMWDDKYHKQALKNVRFDRVSVSEVPSE